MTRVPAEPTTTKTKLRFPSPTSLMAKPSSLLPSFEEREGTVFRYSTMEFTSSGRKSENAIVDRRCEVEIRQGKR